MPSAATVTLTDAVPANHDFDPVSVDSKRTLLMNRESTTSAGNMQLILSFSPANASRPTNRVGIRLNVPYEHVVDDITRVSHTARFVGEFVLPEELTSAQRDDIAAMVQDALGEANVIGYVKSLDPMW